MVFGNSIARIVRSFRGVLMSTVSMSADSKAIDFRGNYLIPDTKLSNRM